MFRSLAYHRLSLSRHAAVPRCRWLPSETSRHALSLLSTQDDDRRRRRRSQPHHRHHSPLVVVEQQHRLFHASTRQEIVPVVIVAGALAFVIGRYSYRALQRMDDEWQEYQYELAQYEKETADNSTSTTNNTAATPFVDGTLAVDLGTIHLKLAHYQRKASDFNNNKVDDAKQLDRNTPNVIITREGDRYRFNGLVYNPETPHEFLVGRRALEQFSKAVLPYRLWTQQESNSEATLQLALDKVLGPAVTDGLGQLDLSASSKTASTTATTLSALSILQQGRLRTVVTLPTTLLHNPHAFALFSHLFPPSSHTAFIPDPVAAIWGAQAMKLIPRTLPGGKDAPSSILVVDVGGLETCLSIVRKDVVEASMPLPNFGGHVFVEQLQKFVLEEHANLKNDALAQQRISLAAHDLMAEFSSSKNNSVKLHLPYITMDLATRQPQHLETTISRTTLEMVVTNYLRDVYVPELLQKQTSSSSSKLLYLSPHVPTPTDFSSFWASCLTQLLEVAQCSPFTISHCLVVGGGSKHPLMELSLRSGLSMLGIEVPRQLVMPAGVLRSELTVMGAATILPLYQYNVVNGLERRTNVDIS